jgi:uncharacterized delta-60 repeat protein
VARRIALAAAAVALIAATPATAAPGDLDPSLGRGGIAILKGDGYLPGPTPVVRADDSVVAGVYSPTNFTPQVARVDAAGVEDASFGTGGVASFGPSVGPGGLSALVADGNSVVAAMATNSPATGNADTVLGRLRPDGSLDPAFGSGGITRIDLGADDRPSALGLATDHSLLVVGSRSVNYGSPAPFAAKVKPDGTLDPAFGGGDGVELNLGGLTSYAAGSVAMAADGSALISLVALGSQPSLVVVKLKPDGSLDSSWAGDGIAELPTPSSFSPYPGASLEMADDGSLFVVANGSSSTAGTSIAHITKLRSDGEPDPSYSGDGRVEIRADTARAAIMADGGLVIAGTVGAYYGDPGQPDIQLVRLLPDGAPDATFSGDGVVTTDIDVTGSRDSAYGVATDSRGRILVFASATAPGIADTRAVLLRYLDSPGSPDADADTRLDPDDACPERFGDLPNGCPVHSVSELTLTYERRNDDFAGAIAYGRALRCLEGALVTVKRKRPGRDPRVGRGSAYALPTTYIDEVPTYRWKVSALAPKARYYAVLAPHDVAGYGHCEGFQTPARKLRGLAR